MANLDDLNVSEDENEVPITDDAERFLAMAESLIDESHVQYARDFIEDVMDSVRKSGTVSDGQWKAVNNIDEGGQRHDANKGRRNWRR